MKRREFRIRDYQSDGIVRPAWIPGDYNPADGFTKLLGTTKFKEFARILGMKDKSIDKDVSIHALKLHFNGPADVAEDRLDRVVGTARRGAPAAP